MDLLNQLMAIGERVEKQMDRIGTEEAAKTAFVMPFIQALGFDIFDPAEVVPEFTADVGTKKGEKVDYAIFVDGVPVILVECKWEGAKLKPKHLGQLYRYFSVTSARIAVLTNGITYQFFSDLEEKNKLDSKPFLVLDMRDLNEQHVAELGRLTKQAFDLDSMLSAAGELKYMREIRAVLAKEVDAPSEEFVRFFFSSVCPGRRLTEGNKEHFAQLVRRAVSQFIKVNVDRRLQSALIAGDTGKHAPVSAEEPTVEASVAAEDEPGDDGVVTTEEELEGFFIVKSILRGAVDSSRITYRDAKTYFAVLLDDNNRKTICRLWLNGVKKKYVGVLDAEKKERKIPIDGVEGIYGLEDELKAALARVGE